MSIDWKSASAYWEHFDELMAKLADEVKLKWLCQALGNKGGEERHALTVNKTKEEIKNFLEMPDPEWYKIWD